MCVAKTKMLISCAVTAQTADLRLCFCVCMLVFYCGGSFDIALSLSIMLIALSGGNINPFISTFFFISTQYSLGPQINA